jgi:3-oxoacyl-[acyl-carrier protein] reductase
VSAPTAIVTGGSRGIGRAVALRLARRGTRVVVCARGENALRETIETIGNAGGAALAVSLDLRDPEAPSRLVRTALESYGGIDIVVNNAGATKRGDFEALTDSDWTDGFALKLFGAVRLTREAWPHLRHGRGSVVNIAGIGGRTPGPQFAIGGAVNAGMLSFTKSLADLGIRDGVQVNAINPGAIRTDRLNTRLAAVASLKGTDSLGAERHFISEAHITRIGEPDDVAGLVDFITSPAGRFLQGSLIDIDGGQTKTL